MTKRPRAKYQVFISSTYSDLREEREAVAWEVLKARQIPSGMENFSATDDRGWAIIQRTIDQSDYYVLLLAGRYGTVDLVSGISWTEREYDYARSMNVPVLAFVRDAASTPASLTEDVESLRTRLKDFSKKVRGAHLCETWTTAADLVARVGLALRNTIDDDEESGHPRPGWYRGDQVPAWNVSEELARLSSENARLRTQLDALSRDQVAALQLVVGEVPLPESLELVRARYVVHPDNPKQNLSFQVMVYGGGETTSDYVAKVNKTFWLSLGVRNDGRRAARDVVASLRFSGVQDVILNRHHEPPTRMPAPHVAQWYLDPQQPVFVDSVRRTNGDVVVKQRIRCVAVGDREDLVRLGIVLSDPTSENLGGPVPHLSYSIINEGGERTEGRVQICPRIEGERQLTLDEMAAL